MLHSLTKLGSFLTLINGLKHITVEVTIQFTNCITITSINTVINKQCLQLFLKDQFNKTGCRQIVP